MPTHIAGVLLKTHVGAAVTALPQVRLGGLGDRVRGAMFASMLAGLKHTDNLLAGQKSCTNKLTMGERVSRCGFAAGWRCAAVGSERGKAPPVVVGAPHVVLGMVHCGAGTALPVQLFHIDGVVGVVEAKLNTGHRRRSPTYHRSRQADCRAQEFPGSWFCHELQDVEGRYCMISWG
ncbi:hypothetical protein MMC22_005886 [Lobaria immixta]|nr:hypothetical protein [Lobaria immixta]